MTFIEQLSGIFDSASAASGIVLAVFLIPIILYALGGVRRGIGRQIIHALTMAVAAVVSFIISRSVWNQLFDAFEGHTVGEYIEVANAQGAGISDEVAAIISALDPLSTEYLAALPIGLIVIPIIFTVVFFLLNLVLRIAYFILSRLLIHNKGGAVSRLTGAVLGAVEGVIIMTLIFLPVNAFYDLGKVTVETLDPEAEVAEVPIFEFTDSIGAGKLIESFSTLKLGDETVKLSDEYTAVLSVIERNYDTLAATDWKQLKDTDKAALKDIVSTATDSPYLATIVSGTLRTVANMVDSGALPLTFEQPYDSILNSALVIFRESSNEYLREDLDTLADIYYILSDDGVLVAMQNGEDLHDVLVAKDEEGKTVVNRIVDVINKNERTSPLITALVRLSLTVMSDTMNVGEDAARIYDDIKYEMNAIIAIDPADYPSNGEYLDKVADELDITLAANGITVERPILDDMAEYIGNNLQGKEDLTEKEFNDLILAYFDSYADYIESNPDAGMNGTSPDAPSDEGDKLGDTDDGNVDGDGWTK